MVWFIDNLSIFATTTTFTTADIFAILVISTILCFIAAMTYKYTHDGISYSPAFVQTIVILGVIVSMIMLIIGNNIAKAFTLLGALSFIRFRNAIKETRDVGAIFFIMAIGMAVGTSFFTLAFLMTFFVCLLIIGMNKMKFGSQKQSDEILKITLPSTSAHEKAFQDVFNQHLSHYNFLNMEETADKEALREITYLVSFKKTTSASKIALINDLKKINPHIKISLFGTERLVY